MLFTELPMPARIAAARAAGFDGAEIQFPEAADIADLRAQSQRHDLPVILINVPRGPGDAVGLASLPGAEAAFQDAVETCAAQAAALGVAKVNVLAGRPPQGTPPESAMATLLANLRHAATRFADIGVKVMVEPVNPGDVPGFFLSSLDRALEVLARADHPNLALQFDLYHMAITEPDLCDAIRRAGPHIGHLQFADTPGRHEPGSGTIDFGAALRVLREEGKFDVISAEYIPARDTTAGLGWMPAFRRMLADE